MADCSSAANSACVSPLADSATGSSSCALPLTGSVARCSSCASPLADSVTGCSTCASPLANPSSTKKILNAFGHSAKHSLGQNFLINDNVVRRIVELSEVNAQDTVLEIGPGIGTLTLALLPWASHVISIERDPSLPVVLDCTLKDFADSFTLIEADAMDITSRELGQAYQTLPNKLIANLPYVISTAVTLQYFQTMPHLQSATIMVQREVGQRMMAKPGTKDYGAYTVKLGLYTHAVGQFSVGHASFMPAPKVESMVVRLDRVQHTDGEHKPVHEDAIKAACMWADAAFASRRKTIGNSCKSYFSSRGEEGQQMAARLPQIFESCGIDSSRRGETLSLEEFLKLGMATC